MRQYRSLSGPVSLYIHHGMFVDPEPAPSVRRGARARFQGSMRAWRPPTRGAPKSRRNSERTTHLLTHRPRADGHATGVSHSGSAQ